MTRFIVPLLLLSACGGSLRTVDYQPLPAAPVSLDAPGPVGHEVVVSARWAVDRSGVIDMKDPKAAELEGGKQDIVLPVHVLTHPTAGVFVIDTGVPRGETPLRGVIKAFAKGIETVEPLADILERQDAALSGVLLTHNHVDHVLGLVDVPLEVPVHIGAGDEEPVGVTGKLTFPTFRRALGDRSLTTWNFDGPEVIDLDGVPAIDIVGDGSLYALAAPGHTPGSTAYLARTPEGPVLFTGDCSHTLWGWDNDVTPGTYTHDHDGNAESLAALRSLAAAHPAMKVEVGHELRQ